jgi:hypothetical protein
MITMQRPLTIKQRWLDHARAVLNLYGNPLPAARGHPHGQNLWHEIQALRERFIVDNHIPWEKYAKDLRHSEFGFILGTTVLNESPVLLHLIENPGGLRKVYPNVFHFGADLEVDATGRVLRGHLLIDRLDEDLMSLLDRDKLATLGNFSSALGIKKPFDECGPELFRLVNPVRQQLLLRLRKQCGLGASAGLLHQIQSKGARCFKDYRQCIEVARLCFALLLIEDREARRRFNSKGSVNGFGDAALIKDALFFNAKILSNDFGVRRMARYCGITTVRELT